MIGQNITEHNPAPSPSGHTLLSGPPTSNDIHQIFSPRPCPAACAASCPAHRGPSTTRACHGLVRGRVRIRVRLGLDLGLVWG
eukprot:scaffold18539_cov54-Phaeocystis_antarctica.AAC.2